MIFGRYIALSEQLLPHNEYSNKVALPNTIIRSGENITIDGITYHFEDLGIGDADDMMVIYLPLQKNLFTGDIVNNHMHTFLQEQLAHKARRIFSNGLVR
jgi:alkyl sulfatase BDS1-like metallo-beta-lactamase superfamily hydrolase